MKSPAWLETFLGFLFPPRCVGCGKEGQILCLSCTKRLSPERTQVSADTWSFFHFQDPLVRSIVHAFKYEQRRALAPILADVIAHSLDLMVGEDAVTIVPIPSSPKERRIRPYDHIALLAEEVAKRYCGPLRITILPALMKTRETLPQVKTKSRSERLANLVGAYGLREEIVLSHDTIVILDDVTTTGATFTEARRAFEHSGAGEIFAVALAH